MQNLAINNSNLASQHQNNLDFFKETLKITRYWKVKKKNSTKYHGLYDSKTGLLHPSIEQFEEFIKKHPFLYLYNNDSVELATLDTRSLILWTNSFSDQIYFNEEAREKLSNLFISKNKKWKLPSIRQLESFIGNEHNPYKKLNELKTKNSTSVDITDLLVYLAKTDNIKSHGLFGSFLKQGYIFACNDSWQKSDIKEVFFEIIKNNWHLINPDGDSLDSTTSLQSSSLEQLQAKLVLNNYLLTSSNDPKIKFDPSEVWIDSQLAELDYTPCRLPKLDASQLTDPEKGLWELWGQDTASLDRLGYIARDPFKDVQRHAVAIDFGTSSTVVAMDTANGAQELLRIGVRDFYQAVEAKHFENPTVLECLDFAAFNKAWQAQAYRPELNWDWMRAAHEAQASFRDNPGDTAILACMIPRLKQWALRSTEDHLLRITGRQGVEVEIPHHLERNPVRGQPIEVAETDIFDPIELYAWYLGMAINWRGRGLFLKYYLSFPVKYPLEVKNRILASFRRGLQRSLPASLINHHPQVLNNFTVNDLASEPAAYAASALNHLGVEPTDDGIVYAVFDFGGGTSDFDFGILRWANDAEEDRGYDRVFEHLASSGDNYLGGENLLEHLVYESFKANLDTLRKERIQFTRPIDAQAFPGSEAFIAATQAAQTNAIMLAAKLRPFMEEEQPRLDSQLKIDLIDADGNKKLCELNLDEGSLDGLLAYRIKRGMQAFLAQLARVKSQLPSQLADAPVHFLLAGNGCRSRHLKALYEANNNAWQDLCKQAFAEQTPEVIIHPPLPMDEANPHAPTAKTGVALGLLQVAPGKNTLLINQLKEQQDGQAPFNWYVGRMRRNKFKVVIEPSAAYGEWFELGPLQQGMFNLVTSSSPRAMAGMAAGDPELTLHPLEFPRAPQGDARLFVRASSPNQLELATACAASELATSQIETLTLAKPS